MFMTDLEAFVAFSRLMLESHDIDPLYPVMRSLYKISELTEDAALQMTVTYLAFYNLPSALTAAQAWSEGKPTPWPMPIAVERRGHRDQTKLAKHFESLREVVQEYGGLTPWLKGCLGPDPVENFRKLYDRTQWVYGNGRWAAFKWVELLKEVHGFPVEAPDMMLKESSGPLDGLRRFAPRAVGMSELEDKAVELRQFLRQNRVPVSWEQLETLLCNWNSLCSGHYYVGHDIDELQHQIIMAPGLPDFWESRLWEARAEALPHQYLGEKHNWIGVQKWALTQYSSNGHLLPLPLPEGQLKFGSL